MLSNSCRPIRIVRTSPSAMSEATRGFRVMIDISPTTSPGPRRATVEAEPVPPRVTPTVPDSTRCSSSPTSPSDEITSPSANDRSSARSASRRRSAVDSSWNNGIVRSASTRSIGDIEVRERPMVPPRWSVVRTSSTHERMSGSGSSATRASQSSRGPMVFAVRSHNGRSGLASDRCSVASSVSSAFAS